MGNNQGIVRNAEQLDEECQCGKQQDIVCNVHALGRYHHFVFQEPHIYRGYQQGNDQPDNYLYDKRGGIDSLQAGNRYIFPDVDI